MQLLTETEVSDLVRATNMTTFGLDWMGHFYRYNIDTMSGVSPDYPNRMSLLLFDLLNVNGAVIQSYLVPEKCATKEVYEIKDVRSTSNTQFGFRSDKIRVTVYHLAMRIEKGETAIIFANNSDDKIGIIPIPSRMAERPDH